MIEFKQLSLLNQLQLVSIFLVILVLPILPRLSSLFIAFSFIISLINKNTYSFKNLHWSYLLFPLLFLYYFISGLWSSNISFWMSDMESKLSFLVFPIIFIALKPYLKSFQLYLFLLFLTSLILSSFISLYYAFECYQINHARQCFEASALSHGMHPGYLSYYYIIALIWGWLLVINKKVIWKLVMTILSVYLIWFIYHFYSIGPIISFTVALCVLSFTYFNHVKKTYLFWVSVLVITVSSIFIIKHFELIESDYNRIKMELTEFSESPTAYYEHNKGNTTSIKARIIIWKISMDLIKEYPLGGGGGDVKNILMDRYKKLDLYEYAEHQLNPHNQYLQTSLALGIPGLFLLFITLSTLLIRAIKKVNYLLVSIITLLFTGLWFESMLEKQTGIVFFMFFIYLVLSPFKQNENAINQ